MLISLMLRYFYFERRRHCDAVCRRHAMLAIALRRRFCRRRCCRFARHAFATPPLRFFAAALPLLIYAISRLMLAAICSFAAMIFALSLLRHAARQRHF